MNCIDYFLEANLNNDKPFLLGRNEELSYVDLINQVLKVEDWLKVNVGKGKRVLLLAPNGIFFMVSYLAIMKSGNVVVPLNPGIESDQLKYIKEQCESKHVIVSTQVKKRLELDNNCLDEQWFKEALLVSNHVAWQKSDTDSSELAEIIFTSGSTALPKGVMLSHQNLIANTNSIIGRSINDNTVS